MLALPGFWGLNFSEGFNTIYRNFDGLEYIIIAKSLYDSQIISALPQSLPAAYFASHFLGYSLLINALAPVLGYLKSMLFVSVASTILAAWTFYFLVRDFKLTTRPLVLGLIFLILPARWLIVHSVGSSEPTFIFLIITSLYFFLKYEASRKYWMIIMASLLGLFAQLTRPPGILLFIALALYVHYKFFVNIKLVGLKKALLQHLKYFPLILIPLGLLLMFLTYQQSYGDFWAYFHSGDNIHLTFPPYQVFNKDQFWVGDIWLEDIVYIFILGFLGGITLWKKKLYPLSFFVLTYLTASTLVAHRDISRYLLPVFPFVLIAFEKVLTSKEFQIVLTVVGLALYLYTQNYILANTAPFPDPQLFN